MMLFRKPNFSLRGAVFRLKWPFGVEKTREIINNLHRYFSIFSWVLHCRERYVICSLFHRLVISKTQKIDFHCSELLFTFSNDVCKTLRDQDKILDEFRIIFQSFSDVRQHIDAATEIANNVLKVVQGESAALDEICEGLKTIKADTSALAAIYEINKGIKSLKDQALASGKWIYVCGYMLVSSLTIQIGSVPGEDSFPVALF